MHVAHFVRHRPDRGAAQVLGALYPVVVKVEIREDQHIAWLGYCKPDTPAFSLETCNIPVVIARHDFFHVPEDWRAIKGELDIYEYAAAWPHTSAGSHMSSLCNELTQTPPNMTTTRTTMAEPGDKR
jgi:hypothetical protein